MMKLITPGGTVTVLPVNGTKVRPPSTETSVGPGPVSVPSVAVPDAGVTVTTVGVVLVFDKVTVKSRLTPSRAVGLLTEITCG